MSIESAQDRLGFLELDEFGVTSIITSSSSGQEFEVVGIFDNTYLNLDLGMGSVSTSEPQFMCRTEDVTCITQGDTLVIDSVSWKITDVQHDGTGMTVLKLHKN